VPRVVSLIASATETVCGLGGEGWLVGRSHECDYPPSIQSLPVLTRPRFDVRGTSGVIDQRVKALLAAGEPIYEVDGGLLRDLKPDVILTQSQCVVCAVSETDLARALGDMTGPTTLSLLVQSLGDLWASIGAVATALGVERRGRDYIRGLQHRVADLAETANALKSKPSVACLEWLDPLMAAGNWVPELVEFAGGLDLFGVAGKHSPPLAYDDLLEGDPDVIIGMPCGYDLPRTRSDMVNLARDPRVSDLKAVRGWRCYATDGNQFFNRPGPRLVESAEILAEILHPEHFDFGHRGKAWGRYPQ
jgi:iron complex transport system substrate-binding protein